MCFYATAMYLSICFLRLRSSPKHEKMAIWGTKWRHRCQNNFGEVQLFGMYKKVEIPLGEMDDATGELC